MAQTLIALACMFVSIQYISVDKNLFFLNFIVLHILDFDGRAFVNSLDKNRGDHKILVCFSETEVVCVERALHCRALRHVREEELADVIPHLDDSVAQHCVCISWKLPCSKYS